jgi:hypothetical protein
MAASGALPACGQAKSDRAESWQTRHTFPPTKFYDAPDAVPGKIVPKEPVSKEPGDLIRSEEFDQYELPSDVLAVRILYRSRSATGQDVVASGVVLYPDAKAPAGGWPVIAWAHAIHAVARPCAPSLARNVQHGPFLAMYVGLGYAVVATDYTGLGTSFRNAFTDLISNATDVIYSVPAARVAVPQLGSRWVAVGIAEGGAAVTEVAELERDLQDQGYLGSIAISGLDNPQDRYLHSDSRALPEMPLLLAYGIKTVYPEFEPKDILTESALARYPLVQQTCGDPGREAKLSPAEILRPNWASNKFVTGYFSRNAPGRKPVQRPMLVISSELDPDMPIQRTAQVIAGMCRQGDRVQFERYPQSDAGRVFGDSVREQIAWIQSRFAGRPAASSCRD